MNWFRMFSEARSDAKLRKLTDPQFRVWFNLLCYASEQDERGVITEMDREILALEVADEDEPLLEETLSRLSRLKIITVTTEEIRFNHWAERQKTRYPSDEPDAAAERKRKQREREANEIQNASKSEKSRVVTSSHEDSHDCHIHAQRAEQSRAELDKEQSRAEREYERETSLPACLPSVASNGLPAPPASAREQCADMLSEGEFKDLIASKWTESEIVTGCQILRERPKRPDRPKGLLHTSILPEVRSNGKVPSAANSPPKGKTPAPTPEDRAAFQAQKAAEMAALVAKREAKNGHATLPD